MNKVFLGFLCLWISFGVHAKKIIIDTDPGIDDLMAIAMAVQSKDIEILGITTIFGNVTTEQATNNALTLVEFFNESIPVYQGELAPLELPFHQPASMVHGIDGFGELFLPLPTKQAQDTHAVQFIIDTIHEYPHEVSLLALGPQTNLAKALQIDPSISALVKEVVVMGGAFETQGNINDYAEANIYNDPHAAQVVAQATWPIHYVGLDVTTNVFLTNELLMQIKDKNPSLGVFVYDAAQFYFHFYEQSYGISNKSHLHDPSAFVYMLHPEYFKTAIGGVEVLTEGKEKGQTVLKSGQGRNNANICIGVDADKVLNQFKSTLSG